LALQKESAKTEEDSSTARAQLLIASEHE